jgi:UDP-N-acetylmuramate--alanine ligase
MLFDILQFAGLNPSIISGAGLVSIMKEGRIGNAKAGSGEWLVIEADESDGSIVLYKPEVGVLLNVDKDHKEMDALMEIFEEFRQHTRQLFVVNLAQASARRLSRNAGQDFSADPSFPAGYQASGFSQLGLAVSFLINGVRFKLNTVGKHNMENALAAAAVTCQLALNCILCRSIARIPMEGIYRRLLGIGKKQGG